MKSFFLLIVFSALTLISFNSVPVENTAVIKENADRVNNIDSLLQSSEIVIIDFWYSACGPCRKSIPEINAIFKEYVAEKVKIYGLNPYDDSAQINSFRESMGVMYPLLPVNSVVIQKYYVSEYPTLMIFQKGKVVLTIEGYSVLTGKQVRTKLESLLKK